MASCLFAAKYTMKAEVYDEVVEQRPSGQLKRNWNYNQPSQIIYCDARTITTSGSRINFVETWGQQYTNSQFISLSTSVELNNRQRIGNITTANGDYIGSLYSTVFDVLGVFPVIDPFGNLVEYTVLAAQVLNLNG